MKDSTQFATIAVGLGVLALVLYKAVPKVAEAVGGIVSGDNALTRNQTNVAGETTTAYQGAGVAGTLGAAANTASGGYLATLGQWIGGKVADWTLPDPMAGPSAKYAKPGITGSGSADPYDAHLMRIPPLVSSAADDMATVNPWATPPYAYGTYAFGA